MNDDSKGRLQVLRNEIKYNNVDRGLRILRQAAQTSMEKLSAVQDIIYASPALKEFVSGIENGQKLVLDISKDTMEKIQSGELNIMKTKDGILKAEICNPNGTVKQHMNLKFEDFCEVPNLTELANMAQMTSMKQQLEIVVEQLESLGVAVQCILVGQQNDRIALYKSGEQLYLESKVTKNNLMQQQLIVIALKSLEDARMQMIENIKTDIASIVAYDNKEIKMKPNELKEKLERINSSFDVINRTSFLKAGIYFELEETEAMMLSLEQYSSFLSDQINKNAKLLYDYDKTDKYIDGKWHERSEKIPLTIDLLVDKYNMDQQVLEIDYQMLCNLGVISHE